MSIETAILSALGLYLAGMIARGRLRFTSELFPVLLPELEVRNDTWGLGHFGAPRTHGTHQGVDFLCYPGQPVYSPVEGTYTRAVRAYADTPDYTGMELAGDGIDEGLVAKLLYMVPTIPLGSKVQRGQQIGICQAISKRYDAQMNDHLHVEIRRDGALVDPYPLFTESLAA